MLIKKLPSIIFPKLTTELSKPFIRWRGSQHERLEKASQNSKVKSKKL